MENVSSPTQSAPEPVRPKANYWMISSIVLLICLILAGVYILKLQRGQRGIIDQPAKSITFSLPTETPATPSNTPSPTVDVTANWKTYQNTINKFSFKYPSDITVKEVHSGYVTATKIREGGILDLSILFYAYKNPNSLSMEDFFTQLTNDITIDVYYKNKNAPHLNINEVSLGQVSALRIVQDAQYFKQQSTPRTNYMVSNGRLMYQIVTAEYDGKYDGKSTSLIPNQIDQAAVKQILSTFTFTE